MSAMGYYNLLFLYDDKGHLEKTVQVGKNKITPKVTDGHYLSDDCFIFLQGYNVYRQIYLYFSSECNGERF